MKKTISMIFILLCLSFACVAETASSSMEVAAYKTAPLPTLSYTISVKDYTKSSTGSEITGITNVYDISSSISSNRTISKAFAISVSSNLKASINIGIKFTPFVNQSDKTITMPVTYTFSASELSTVVGTTYYNSTKSGRTTTYYFARYTPSFEINSSTNGSFYISEDLSYSLTFNPAKKIETGTATTNKTSKVSNWSTSNTMPTSTATTLPGIGTNKVSGTANFGISIADDDYTAMRANTDYVTTVTITISTV